jgi:hypothetical protein
MVHDRPTDGSATLLLGKEWEAACARCGAGKEEKTSEAGYTWYHYTGVMVFTISAGVLCETWSTLEYRSALQCKYQGTVRGRFSIAHRVAG